MGLGWYEHLHFAPDSVALSAPAHLLIQHSLAQFALANLTQKAHNHFVNLYFIGFRHEQGTDVHGVV